MSLAPHLQRCGLSDSAESLTSLAQGIAAAAPSRKRRAWAEQVDARADEGLLNALEGLIAEARVAFEPTPWTPARLQALRAELKRRNLQGFFVPRGDEHQGEYVPARAERLRWITGFAGSAGAAAVLEDKAAVFVDGRYTLQARQQVDGAFFEYRSLTDEPLHEWLLTNAQKGQRLGIDPWLFSEGEVERLETAAEKVGAELVWCDSNPIDAAWADQPPAPLGLIRAHPDALTGKKADNKRHELGDALLAAKQDVALLSLPDSIAWLLNIRGSDVPRAPLPLAFAALHSDGTVDLFVDDRKLGEGVASWLGAEVRRHHPSRMLTVLQDFGTAGLRVRVEKRSCPAILARTLTKAGCTLVHHDDPCQLPKARKNEVELDGFRAAHRRDGLALTRFLAWLDHNAATGTLTEIEASDTLEALRAESPELLDLSFDTISGAGAHGAIVHYRASPESDAPLKPNSLYLVDSGAQYADGTTDVTRTVAIGTPTVEMRDRFTRVLKGHIAVAQLVFAPKTTGGQLDAFARLPLWQVGLDYEHGTGHGVGHYLSVHEGPQNMSRRDVKTPLEVGMVISNEPGYYKAGEYGIRIENLVVVRKADQVRGERDMLCFETLTLAPIDRRLVETTLLSTDELEWLNDYHRRVRDTLRPHVNAETAAWLDLATAPL